MTAQSFKPFNNTVLIKPEEEIKQTDSGIILPVVNAEERKHAIGVIVDIDDREVYNKRYSNDFKIGDKVLFEDPCTAFINNNGEDLLRVPFDNILAVVTEDLDVQGPGLKAVPDGLPSVKETPWIG